MRILLHLIIGHDLAAEYAQGKGQIHNLCGSMLLTKAFHAPFQLLTNFGLGGEGGAGSGVFILHAHHLQGAIGGLAHLAGHPEDVLPVLAAVHPVAPGPFGPVAQAGRLDVTVQAENDCIGGNPQHVFVHADIDALPHAGLLRPAERRQSAHSAVKGAHIICRIKSGHHGHVRQAVEIDVAGKGLRNGVQAGAADVVRVPCLAVAGHMNDYHFGVKGPNPLISDAHAGQTAALCVFHKDVVFLEHTAQNFHTLCLAQV